MSSPLHGSPFFQPERLEQIERELRSLEREVRDYRERVAPRRMRWKGKRAKRTDYAP